MHLKFKKIGTGIAAAVLTPLLMTQGVFAWGPERPQYTMDNPAEHAVFNSIVDNPAVGNEFDFVRVVEKNTGNEYVSNLTIEAGKQYEVYIYYHNDASATYNDREHNYIGGARETRMSSSFPLELAANQRGTITGRISSTTTTPAAVWDEAYVTAKQAMTLHYVEGSAKIYNNWPVSGSVLSTRLFSTEGTYIGLTELNGVIPGCEAYSGSVIYTIQTVAKDTPSENPDPIPDPEPEPDPDEPTPDPTPNPEPEPDPEPVNPEVPSELPTTGPLEVVLAIVVVAIIVAGILYWRKTQKAVKKASRHAKGKK